MTKREVISRLRQDLREHFADSVLYNRYLWSTFWDSAKLLLQREYDGGKLKDQSIYQTYHIDTEEVNIYEGSCVPLDCIACRIKIPPPMMGKNGPMYSFLGSVDMATRYAIVNPTEFEIKSKIKGTRQRYAFLEDGYLYLSKCTPCVKFSVIPNDAMTDAKCGVLDSPAYVPDYLIDGPSGVLAVAKDSITKLLSKPYDHSANKNETT